MSAIEGDKWSFESRIALEELGWSLDDDRYEPDDISSVLAFEETDGSITIIDPLRDDSEGITVPESLFVEVAR